MMNRIIRIDHLQISSIIIATALAYYIIPKIIKNKNKIPIILELKQTRPIENSICKVELIIKFKISESDEEYEILKKPEFILKRVEISGLDVELFNFDTLVSKVKKKYFINNQCKLYSKGTFLDYNQIVSEKIDIIYQEFDYNFHLIEYNNDFFFNTLQKLDKLSNLKE